MRLSDRQASEYIQIYQMKDVDGFVEYTQNRPRVAQMLFEHCVLYVSLNFMQPWKLAENES